MIKLFKKKVIWYKLLGSIEEANANVSIGEVMTVNACKKKLCLAHIAEGFFEVKTINARIAEQRY